MLNGLEAFSSYSVNDINTAKEFYGATLGLEVKEEYGGLSVHTKGNNPIMLYPKENHEPSTYTVFKLHCR